MMNVTFLIEASFGNAPLRDAPPSSASPSSASTSSATTSFTRVRSALNSLASVKSAPERFARVKFASFICAYLRDPLLKAVWLKSTPARSAPDRSTG